MPAYKQTPGFESASNLGNIRDFVSDQQKRAKESRNAALVSLGTTAALMAIHYVTQRNNVRSRQVGGSDDVTSFGRR